MFVPGLAACVIAPNVIFTAFSAFAAAKFP